MYETQTIETMADKNREESLVELLQTGIGLFYMKIEIVIPKISTDVSCSDRTGIATPDIDFWLETENFDSDKYLSKNNWCQNLIKRIRPVFSRSSQAHTSTRRTNRHHRQKFNDYQDLIDWIDNAFQMSHGAKNYQPTRYGLQLYIYIRTQTDDGGHDSTVLEDNHNEDVEIDEINHVLGNIGDERNQDDHLMGDSLLRLIDMVVWLASWEYITIGFYGFRRGEGVDLFIKYALPTFSPTHSSSSSMTTTGDDQNSDASPTVFATSALFVFPPSLEALCLFCESVHGDEFCTLQLSEDPDFYHDDTGAENQENSMVIAYEIAARLITSNLLDPFVESFFGGYDQFFNCEDGSKTIALASSFFASSTSSTPDNSNLIWEGDEFYDATYKVDQGKFHSSSLGDLPGSKSRRTATLTSSSSEPLILPQFGDIVGQIVLYGDFDFTNWDGKQEEEEHEADLILNKVREWLLPSKCPQLERLSFRDFQTQEHMAKVVNFISSVDESAFTELCISFDYGIRQARQMFGGKELSYSDDTNHCIELLHAFALCNRGNLDTITIKPGAYEWSQWPPEPSPDVEVATRDKFRNALKHMFVNNLSIEGIVLEFEARPRWYNSDELVQELVDEDICLPLFRFRSLLSCLDRYHPTTIKLWSLFITEWVTSNFDESNDRNDAVIVADGGSHDDGSLDSDKTWEDCARTVVFELIRDYADVLTSQK